MNADPGGITVRIDDRETSIAMTGGGEWLMPIGPLSLVDGELERADRPTPTQLVNALGAVEDHFDDVVRDAPMIEAAPSVEFDGPHAREVAYVEVGTRELPDDYVVRRADLDEVFRTIVAEPIAERLHNPGLDPERVESIVATCCVILAIIRRLDHQSATIGAA